MARWSQIAKNQSIPRKDRKEKSSGIPFNNAYRHEIKLGHDEQNILFINAEYPSYEDPDEIVPFWERPRHTFVEQRGGRRFFRSYLCPRGRDRSIDCESCRLYYDEKDPRISTRRTKYFPVISLEWHLLKENQYGDKDYTLEKACTPVEIRRHIADGARRVFGRKGYIAFGTGHAKQFFGIVDSVEEMCMSCAVPGITPARVYSQAFTCNSCCATLQDMETTELSRKEIDEFPYRKTKCHPCGYYGLPDVVHGCESCEGPQPASLFDVVVPLAKRGEATESRILVPHGKEIEFVINALIPSDQAETSETVVHDGAQFADIIADLYDDINFPEMFSAELHPSYQKERVFG